MLGATAARTKYKSATTTQNIATSQPASTRAASRNGELGGAEPENVDQHPVPGDGVMDRDHAAGHHNHAAPQRRPRGGELLRQPGERVQWIAHHVAAAP